MTRGIVLPCGLMTLLPGSGTALLDNRLVRQEPSSRRPFRHPRRSVDRRGAQGHSPSGGIHDSAPCGLGAERKEGVSVRIPTAYTESYRNARATDPVAVDNYLRHTGIGDPELDPDRQVVQHHRTGESLEARKASTSALSDFTRSSRKSSVSGAWTGITGSVFEADSDRTKGPATG